MTSESARQPPAAGARLHRARGNPRLGLLLALCTTVLWGFLSIALKLLLEGMDAFTITWYRLTAAAVVLALYQARRGRLPAPRRLGRNVWVLLVVATFGLVGNYVLFLVSLEYVPPATSQLVIQLAPILFLLGGLLIFRETFSRMQWIGLAVLVAGLLLFFNQRLPALLALSGAEALGVGLVVVAGIVWAAYALAQKQLLMALSSVNILLLIYIGCTVLLLPLARPATILSLSPAHLALLAFCTFNTLGAYGCFAEALAHWEASRVSAVIALTPLVTIAAVLGFAAIWPGTDMAAGLDGVGLLGGLVVVVGSVMTALGTGRSRARRRLLQSTP
jgi:drug/metabolite transporter (DMT)-like permease